MTQPRRLWLDLGDFGALDAPVDPTTQWQDHGLGLLRTILHRAGVQTDIASTRAVAGWRDVDALLAGYDVLLMNVRSYTFPVARDAAKLFKRINPAGLCIVGGMHASVAPDEMLATPEFDRVCLGPGEQVIVDLVTDPAAFPRSIPGKASASMGDWPAIDRTLWPKPSPKSSMYPIWPLERSIGWGPDPVATVLTSRVCPWQCVFCNEHSFIANMGRKPVDQLIDELNALDETLGPLGSVVIHDSMFFQNPSWLKEWLEKYPRRANALWPYWAAARADTVRKWPDLFEALVRETNWRTVSIGFESGSANTLRTLNKECTPEDNHFAIDLLNRIGDDMERQGKTPPFFWSNIMLAIPGETREDAFETQRMVRFMKRKMISPAFYAPYPGSALGHQIIAEGKSLMNEAHTRYASDVKMTGIDYPFYRRLMGGAHDDEIAAKEWGPVSRRSAALPMIESQSPECKGVMCNGPGESVEPTVYPADGADMTSGAQSSPPERPKRPHQIYLFPLRSGRRRLAYGESPEDALDVLRLRMTEAEMQEIDGPPVRISQRDLQKHAGELG